MIDTTTENLLSFSDAAAILPDRPHLSTLHRWRLHGVKGVQLETVLVGGRRYTSNEALARFIARTTAAVDGDTTGQTITTGRRERDLARVERELSEAGI